MQLIKVYTYCAYNRGGQTPFGNDLYIIIILYKLDMLVLSSKIDTRSKNIFKYI